MRANKEMFWIKLHLTGAAKPIIFSLVAVADIYVLKVRHHFKKDQIQEKKEEDSNI